MLSRWFRYLAPLASAGLMWAGVHGSARAATYGQSEMSFEGFVKVWMPAEYITDWYPLQVMTPSSRAGMCHFGMISGGRESAPRVGSAIAEATGSDRVGSGAIVVRGPTPSGDNGTYSNICLDGDGQTQFDGGPVIIGARRWDEGVLDPPTCDYLNVYSSDENHDGYLSPEAVGFKTHDGVGTVRAEGASASVGTLYLEAGSGQVVIKDTGNVGLGTASPNGKLDVSGAVYCRNASAPTAVAGGGFIYATGDELHAKDGSGNDTVFSPHTDPRSVDPQAQTSFADPSVALPFSFHQKNSLVGKGEVVDMSKMVVFVENMMKAQLGEEAGKLRYDYDLPAGEKTTIEQSEQQRVQHQAEAVMAQAEAMGWIPVPLGTDGEFPAEAVEEVPEIKPELQDVVIRKSVPDFDSGRIVTVERHELQAIPVPTGRTTKQFKADWKFENGVLYRRATAEDVIIEDFAQPFEWPQWIVDRVPGGAQQISQSASQLIGQIKAMLARVAKKGSAQVAEAKAGK